MIRLHALGQNLVVIGETRLTPTSETLFALAVYLVVEAGRPVERERLVELFWPDADEERGHHRLRQTVYRLNAAGAALRSDRARVVLPTRSAQSDFTVVLQVVDGLAAERAVESIQGSFLPDYAPRISAGFTDWLEHQRGVVNAALRRVLVAAIGEKRSRGEWAATEHLANRCLAIDPLNEEATLAIAEAAAIQGSKARALEILDAYEREVGVVVSGGRPTASALRRRIAEAYRGERLAAREVPQVGREAEMAELSRALQQTTASRGSSFYIWGEAGIGKTRLVTEFARAAASKLVRVVRLACQPHDQRRPLSVFIDMVPRLLDLPGALGCSPDSMQYLRRLMVLQSPEHHASIGMDVQSLFEGIRRALFDILDAISSEACVAIVVEDAHWLDVSSLDLLNTLSHWLRTRRMALVLTSRTRPDTLVARDLSAAGVTLMELVHLDEGTSRQLVRGATRVAGRASEREFEDWCIAAGGGNPYYLIELSTHARKSGPQYRAPTTLSRLVEQRLGNLSEGARRVLQVCCVLGRLSTLDRLESLVQENRFRLLGSIDELDAAGFIELDHSLIACKHHILAEAALRQLSPTTRRLLHLEAAKVLELERQGDSGASLLWECADHWFQAGEKERARQLLRDCARHSLEIGLPLEAARLCDRAAELSDDPREKLTCLRSRSEALFLAGAWQQLIQSVDEVFAFQRECDLPLTDHDDDELLLFLARWRMGYDPAALLEEAAKCAETRSAAPVHRLRAATWALVLADNMCDGTTARRVYRALQTVLEDDAVDITTRVYFSMVYHSSFGEIALGAGFARQLRKLCDGLGPTADKARYLSHVAVALRCCDAAPREAIEAAEAALEIAEQHGMANYAAPAANQLVLVYLAIDDLAKARYWLDRAICLLGASTEALGQSTLLSNAAEIALREGHLDQASELITRSEEVLGGARSARTDARFASFNWYLALSRGTAKPTEADIQYLSHLHKRTRTATDQDRLAAVLARLYLQVGKASEAARVVHDYLQRYRRNRARLAPELGQVVGLLFPGDNTHLLAPNYSQAPTPAAQR